MKRTLLLLLSLVMALSLAITAFAGDEETKWAQDNGLLLDESMDELYEKAKAEGKLVISTISSRTQKVANAFMEMYPGIDVEVYDISSGVLKEKFVTEYESGIYTVDILHSKEQVGEYTFELFKEGWLHNYQPPSIFGNVPDSYKTLTPLMLELNLWFYNTEVYDKSPITSWWDLTREDWRGRVVFQDAASNDAYCAALTAMVQHADQMAEDYEKVFGEPIQLDADEPNAGYAFIKRFLANNPVMAKGSDEVIELVGSKGQTNPPVGYSSSVKLRKKDEGFAINYGPKEMQVANGIPALNFISIANKANHPNAAKMFIKFWMGGEDGKGVGYAPLVSLGSWSVRPENESAEGNIPLADIPLWEVDFDYIYMNIETVRDYWITHRN
ncbi:MAG: ABC transporter substrate-binding protein [Clostridiales bacterium]|nr:ABC transporter substrate-binding protein [Clostridiales bacterium]